jgi:hypothetical protein
MFDARQARIQKVRAECHDVLGPGEVVRGHLVDAEYLAVGGARRLGGEWLVPRNLAAECAHPLAQQIRERAAPRTRDDRNLVPRSCELVAESRNRIIPGDLLELPVCTARHGGLQTSGIVQPLECGLAP